MSERRRAAKSPERQHGSEPWAWLPQEAQHLRLRLQEAIGGLQGGAHRSPLRGGGVEFVEHRPYQPGDEPRTIDWRAFARSDRWIVRRFEDEARLRAWLLLDGSGSMAYRDKREHAAVLLGAIGWVLLRQGDAVGGGWLRDGRFEGRAPRGRWEGLRALMQQWATERLEGRHTALGEALDAFGAQAGRRSLVLVASDLMQWPIAWRRSLQALAARGHRLWVLHVLHRDELELPFQEPARFEGLEGEEALEVDPEAIRDASRRAASAFVEECRTEVLRAGGRYWRLLTDEPAAVALRRMLQAGVRASAPGG